MIEHDYFKLFQKDNVDKQLILEFDNGVTITNEDIFSESLNLDESLCSEDQLTFGCCEASVFKIQIANLMSSCKGLWFNVYIQLDGNDDKFPVGRYKVYSDELTADRLWRKITAYDKMYDIINIDVADWYNELLPDTSSTVTLKEFRDSFFNHFGIEQTYSIKPLYPANGGITENAYTNDDMIVEKTIDPSEISGKDVITAICQLKGCFGHITRDGKFKYIYLPQDFNGLFPSEELYPSDTLYPSDGSAYHKLNSSNYISATYEDYLCRTIDKIQIRKEEGDIGTIVGDGDNCYIIEDNFLVYGKNAEELEQIATNLLPVIENCVYRPFEATLPGNLCMEVGDTVKLYTKYQDVESYILKRTLKGIQALRDDFVTEGVEEYSEKVNSVNKSIIELKGKTNTLERTVEKTQETIRNVEEGLQSQITQTAESITSEVTRATNAEGELSAKIQQTAESITTTVSSIQVGGRNLLLNSDNGYLDDITATYPVDSSFTFSTVDGWRRIAMSKQLANEITHWKWYTPTQLGNYTFSLLCRSNATSIKTSISLYNNSTGHNIKEAVVTKVGDKLWKIVSSFELDNLNNFRCIDLFGFTTTGATYVEFRYPMLELGNKATDWTPAPEDTDSQISSLSSEIKQTAEEISTKVEKNGVISAINQTAESIKISADRINLSGYVTASSLTSSGTTVIDGSRITSGAIQGVTIISKNSSGTYVEIDNGFISGGSSAGESGWIEFGGTWDEKPCVNIRGDNLIIGCSKIGVAVTKDGTEIATGSTTQDIKYTIDMNFTLNNDGKNITLTVEKTQKALMFRKGIFIGQRDL